MIACVLFICSTIGLISTFSSHTLAQSRDTYKQRGKEPERTVQTNSFGQEANYGRPHQHATITCSTQGSNSEPLWHRVLRTRKPEQDGHDVCGSKAYKNETSQRYQCGWRKKKDTEPEECDQPAQRKYNTISEVAHDTIPSESAKSHSDGEEHISQPAARRREQSFAYEQQGAPIEESTLDEKRNRSE
jgi:hypothetical protein